MIGRRKQYSWLKLFYLNLMKRLKIILTVTHTGVTVQLVLGSLTRIVTEFQFSLASFSCWRPNRGLSIP